MQQNYFQVNVLLKLKSLNRCTYIWNNTSQVACTMIRFLTCSHKLHTMFTFPFVTCYIKNFMHMATYGSKRASLTEVMFDGASAELNIHTFVEVR